MTIDYHEEIELVNDLSIVLQQRNFQRLRHQGHDLGHRVLTLAKRLRLHQRPAARDIEV